MSGKRVTVLVVDDMKGVRDRIRDIEVLPMVYPIQRLGKVNRRIRRARERKLGISSSPNGVRGTRGGSESAHGLNK